jgi:hypothetical protein
MQMKTMRQLLIIMSFLTTIFGAFRSEAQEQPKKADVKFSDLTNEDRARLDKQRQVVLSVLKDKFGVAALNGDKSDLKLIQRILDEKVFNPSQTYELQSLGIVFGDVLAKELGLHWAIITDEYGTDPTLRFENTSINFNALTMISKRVERGEKVDVEDLFEWTGKQLAELKNKVDK